MKRWLRIGTMALVLGFLTLGLADQECPPPSAVMPGFEYDAGRVLWPIIKAECWAPKAGATRKTAPFLPDFSR